MVHYTTMINGIPVHAQYTEASVQEIFLPLLCRLTAMQRKKNGRILAMLAAPPGAGKSTLAGFLQMLARYVSEREDPPHSGKEILQKFMAMDMAGSSLSLPSGLVKNNLDIKPVTVIGMDGFHRYQEDLLAHKTVRRGREISLVEIKGAPMTFDLPALTERIRQVAAGEACGWPEYNRLLHNPVENAITVRGDIVLLEGNYLLMDRDGWRDLAGFADYTIRITADEQMLKKRLVERKISSGADPQAALRFVESSDLENVRECLMHIRKADLNLVADEHGAYHKV